MWYLVNLPGNKLNVAVKTEKNSIAADCLNKVSVQCDIIKIVFFRHNKNSVILIFVNEKKVT